MGKRVSFSKEFKIEAVRLLDLGTRVPGTVSGNEIPDHQLASGLNALGVDQHLYPHCIDCRRAQMREVRQEQLRRKRSKK